MKTPVDLKKQEVAVNLSALQNLLGSLESSLDRFIVSGEITSSGGKFFCYRMPDAGELPEIEARFKEYGWGISFHREQVMVESRSGPGWMMQPMVKVFPIRMESNET